MKSMLSRRAAAPAIWCWFVLAGACGALLVAHVGAADPPATSSRGAEQPSSPESAADEDGCGDRADGGLRPVMTGIDVLVRDSFQPLAGARVGLITNHTGVTRDGTSTVEVLARSQQLKLVSLFSPEHGFDGRLDVSRIGDSQDPTTGLQIYSLYGETRTPTAESLAEIDTLVFDIQDIGTRFYTYISTMGNAMRAAAEHGKRFVVLDRPNPINGVDVAGPVLDAGRESFVGYHRIPIRHGMTVGELAQMFRAELQLELDLLVVQMEGWQRCDYYDATGLLWIGPSPNMRNLNQALLYPGVGLLETTNLSVGRGTDTPFEIIGAPWIDARRLGEALNRAGLAGVRFVPLEFTPQSSVHAGEKCGGVQILITDRQQLCPMRVGFEIAHQLRRLFPTSWEVDRYDRLLGDAATLAAMRQAEPVARVQQQYAGELDEFLTRRSQYLLYP